MKPRTEPATNTRDRVSPILKGQQQVATIINALMQSSSWGSSIFFLSYDEPGGPFDHVPPVPNHSNDNTDSGTGTYPDISSIAVNADSYNPCLPREAFQHFTATLRPATQGRIPAMRRRKRDSPHNWASVYQTWWYRRFPANIMSRTCPWTTRPS